jgi:hypothetical protein
MEHRTWTNKVTPYELATLASRIDPKGCASEPQGAIAGAVTLLFEAICACAREEADWKKSQRVREELNKWETESRIDWVRGTRFVTGQRRRERAIKCFCKFMKHQEPENDLSDYKRDGFTMGDLVRLAPEFERWKKQPKRKKGKQGRRISESDGRLRIGSLRLAATKPQRAA